MCIVVCCSCAPAVPTSCRLLLSDNGSLQWALHVVALLGFHIRARVKFRINITSIFKWKSVSIIPRLFKKKGEGVK